ncbi:MAG: sugar phosphate isomerase/epimerase [Planctomycetes bacterium]|nr:sugar phosphate isomerase/epimerase [Planctomycetota bacterium]
MAANLKKGISYWSFEGGLEGKADISKVLREAKQQRFDSVELSCPGGAITLDSTEAQCKEIAKEAAGVGVAISSVATGLYWGKLPTSSDANVRKESIEITQKILHIAKWLGVDAMLYIPGAVDVFFDPKSEHLPYKECWKRAQASLKASVKTAEKLKVSLCVENVWNKFLLSPNDYIAFIDSFKSKQVKAYFDVGNVRLLGFPEHWIEMLGKKRLGRVHWKDFKFKFYGGGESGEEGAIADGCRKIAAGSAWAGAYSFCDLGAGDVDWPKVLAAFKKVGYTGYCTAEMLPPAAGLVERVSKDMDRILGR